VSQQSETYYATVLERGEHWDASRPMREQQQWQEHLAFLDALLDDGLLMGGGPPLSLTLFDPGRGRQV
jgi:hypothetical protein